MGETFVGETFVGETCVGAMDEDEAKAWAAELDHLEEIIKKGVEARAKPLLHETMILKKAFKLFDADNSGHISYKEFVRALGKFGLTGTQVVRGLFDRYAQMDGDEHLSYGEFATGLFGETKPPLPSKKDRSIWAVDDGLSMRTSPANKWEGSRGEVPSPTRAVRVRSVANGGLAQAPLKWTQDADGNWSHD